MNEPKSIDDLLNSIPTGARGVPGIHVPANGDCLFVYLEDAPYHAIFVDPILTVFEALDDSRLVGFELKGLSSLEVDGFKGVDFKQSPPIIALLFASYHLHADGVEEAGTRARVYSKVAAATARALDLQAA